MPYPLPALEGAGRLRQLGIGLRYPFQGIRLVLTHPSTWPYLIAPTLINAAILLTAMFVSWHGISFLMSLIWAPGPEHHAALNVAWYVTAALLRALAFLVIGVTLYFTAGLIGIPFNDRLSEAVETMCLGPYEEEFSFRVLAGDIVVSVLHSATSLVLWLTVMVLLLGFELVPVVGSAVHFVLGTLATSLFLAREMMDGCLSRRRLSFAHKLRVVRANLWIATGFGLVASAMLWIPGLNFVLLPMVVAGGTLLYCHLETLDRVPDASGSGRYVPLRQRNAALADHDLATAEEARDVVFDPADDRAPAGLPAPGGGA